MYSCQQPLLCAVVFLLKFANAADTAVLYPSGEVTVRPNDSVVVFLCIYPPTIDINAAAPHFTINGKDALSEFAAARGFAGNISGQANSLLLALFVTAELDNIVIHCVVGTNFSDGAVLRIYRGIASSSVYSAASTNIITPYIGSATALLYTSLSFNSTSNGMIKDSQLWGLVIAVLVGGIAVAVVGAVIIYKWHHKKQRSVYDPNNSGDTLLDVSQDNRDKDTTLPWSLSPWQCTGDGSTEVSVGDIRGHIKIRSNTSRNNNMPPDPIDGYGTEQPTGIMQMSKSGAPEEDQHKVPVSGGTNSSGAEDDCAKFCDASQGCLDETKPAYVAQNECPGNGVSESTKPRDENMSSDTSMGSRGNTESPVVAIYSANVQGLPEEAYYVQLHVPSPHLCPFPADAYIQDVSEPATAFR